MEVGRCARFYTIIMVNSGCDVEGLNTEVGAKNRRGAQHPCMITRGTFVIDIVDICFSRPW